MAKKCILLVRVSSKKQDFDEQENEIFNMALADGYSEENIIPICEKESGIKLAEEERSGLNRMKELIESDSSINCVYCWEVSRIARRKKINFSVLDYLVERHIQLIIKTPFIKLLNPDNTINEGAEIVFTLFSQMAESEMRTKFARFQRSKRVNRETGKYNGGNITFGYDVDENGYLIPSEKEAPLVKEMFRLYSSGKYSLKSLKKEMAVRGMELPVTHIHNILTNKVYYNGVEGKKYIPIITKDVFDQCAEIRTKNNKAIVKTDSVAFALKILKCKYCGYNFSRSGNKVYTCINHINDRAKCSKDSISIFYMDLVLIYIALFEHKIFMSTDKKDKINGIIKENESYQMKIEYNEKLLSNIDGRMDRTNMLFIDGKISNEKYNELSSKIGEEAKVIQKENEQLVQRIENNNHLISTLQDGNNRINMFGELTLNEMNDMVHQYCTTAHITPSVTNGKPTIDIEVNFKSLNVSGEFELRTRYFKYFPKSKTNRLMENDEYIDESIKKMLGNLYDIVRVNCLSPYWKYNK